MNKKTLLLAGLPLIILILVTLAVVTIQPGGIRVVRLGSAPPLSGAIAQSVGTAGEGASLSKAGTDFTIQSTHYLDNQDWVVVKVALAKGNAGDATIVMQKVNDTYHIILGPGTAFSIKDTVNVPSDVVAYLKAQGVVIYAPAN